MRMKKRTNWFLSPNSSAMDTTQSESMIGGGSGDHSVDGKSSYDATSSEALLSDVTASDGGLSDSGLRLASDMDTTEPSLLLPLPDGKQRLQQHRHSTTDVINGNHRTSTPAKPSGAPRPGMTMWSPSSPRHHSGSRSPSPQVQVTDHDVRYFMVENFYGSGSSASPGPIPQAADSRRPQHSQS